MANEEIKKDYGWDEEIDTSEVSLEDTMVFPAGTYSFEIRGAERQISKAGNNMVKVTLAVVLPENKTGLVTDYLVLSSSSLKKLATFFISTGYMKPGEKIKLSWLDTIKGKVGRAKFKVDHDPTGTYADKNSVGWYLPTEASQAPKTPMNDMPFEV